MVGKWLLGTINENQGCGEENEKEGKRENGKKIKNMKVWGGDMIEMYNVYPCNLYILLIMLGEAQKI